MHSQSSSAVIIQIQLQYAKPCVLPRGDVKNKHLATSYHPHTFLACTTALALSLELRDPTLAKDRLVPLLRVSLLIAWEKQVLSARGFKQVGRHSEYAI